jgi:hypothetical protein
VGAGRKNGQFLPVCLLGPEKKSARQRVRLSARAMMAADMYSINWLPAPTWLLRIGIKNFSSWHDSTLPKKITSQKSDQTE